MKKKPSTAEPLRKSISVSVSEREHKALTRLGNKFGSRSDQLRECIDQKKLAEKIEQAEKLEAETTMQNRTP
jgi:hypothetical protein